MGIRPADLFSDTKNPIEITERFETYKDTLEKSFNAPLPGVATPEQLRVHKAVAGANLTKAASDEVLTSLKAQLSGGFIGKDLSLTGPGSTGGLHQYDLSSPARQLVPVNTPLRNRLPRLSGVGTAHEYKTITGYSGSGTGGVGQFHPGQPEGETVQFGSLNLARGKIIEFNGDHLTVPFRKFSTSSRVPFDTAFAGNGFQDVRQLSITSALRSAMLLEERMLLGSRGTASGFSGALSAPGAPTVVTPAADGDQTAVTGVTGANVYVLITATTGWGETALSTAGNSAFSSGDVITINWTHVPGATGYNVFVGQGSSAPASTAMYFQGSTAANTITLQGAIKTSGRNATDVSASDTPTAFSDGYDGIIPILLDSNRSGYVGYENGPISVAAFQNAFAAMYDNVQADPATVLLNGHDRLALSNLLTGSSTTGYRITLENGPNGSNAGTVGAIVTSVQNGITGTVVDLEHHPFMPQGIAPILSWQIPVPDANISDAWAVVNTTDYMALEWTQIDFNYDCSVYWRGTFCGYAPAWSGVVAGLTAS